MKKNDGRRNNDNSRLYHVERVEEVKKAIGTSNTINAEKDGSHKTLTFI